MQYKVKDNSLIGKSPHDVVNLLAELEQGVNLVGPLQLPVVARQLVDQLLALPD